MVESLKFKTIFVFLFLVVFPFGQIVSIGLVKPIDVVVGFAALYAVTTKQRRPDGFKYINLFLGFALLSWVISILLFPQIEVLYGLMYLVRLCAYAYFLIYVWNFAKSKKSKDLLINSLLSVSVVSAVFGWIQIFGVPDTRALFTLGWDDHFLRMIGTFLDPTFLGLILVLGVLISIYRYIDTGKKYFILISLFLTVSLAFTYSRASYLAFFAGASVFAYYKKFFGKLIIFGAIFIGMVLVLPTSKNHILRFTRQFSAIARVENYKTTLTLFKKSPVFGVGYDNMCIAYQKFIGPQSFASHACSGSDSSILFVLTTTGVLGLMMFIYLIGKINDSTLHSAYHILLTSSFAALMVHSMFSNSLFYPWVMGWIIILLAVSLVED